ncbi:hypothetical protein ACHHYP_08396 [Achlya hypogyna]|uniref:Transmembrane protein n=1 Tax=Achlya hypogyna TaxID=1202772 RepID=A0A1V9YPP0_ACHHY|nr:hypothetical protein ACHHYP_08396 [Achlya hypogyna]
MVLKPSSQQPAAAGVSFKLSSIFVSGFLFINVTIMPLKAYISEPFPWVPRTSTDYADLCATNFTACEETLVALFQSRSRSAMVASDSFVFGQAYDLTRQVISIPPGIRLPDSSFLLETSYGQFYSERVRTQLLQVGAGLRNASDFHCLQISRMAGSAAAYAVFWIEPGPGTDYTFYVGIELPAYTPLWRWSKFFFRAFLAVALVHLMWTRYYVHYIHLVRHLRTIGLGAAAPATYYVLVGDPTSVVLLHPGICLAFIFDFFASSDYASRALVRICQTKNLGVFFIASLYLSRTVWFAYASLSAVSHVVLRRVPHLKFAEVDPGLLAIAIFIVAGPVTYLQSRSLFFIDLYHFIDTCLLSGAARDEATEGLIGGVLFIFIFGTLPLNYGFGKPATEKIFKQSKRALRSMATRRTTMQSVSEDAYASVDNNDLKHRMLVRCSLYSFRHKPIVYSGGTLNALFLKDPRYKRYGAISQTGADCYVIFRRSGSGDSEVWACVRLSLLQSARGLFQIKPKAVGPAPKQDTAPKQDSSDIPPSAVAKLHLRPTIKLDAGDFGSPWTM